MYSANETGHTCSRCGFNYLEKWPLSSRCPHCRRTWPYLLALLVANTAIIAFVLTH